MLNHVARLNTKKYINAALGDHYDIKYGVSQVQTKKVYAINDLSNCVILQQKRYRRNDKIGSDWVVKYDVSRNKEIWAYRQDTKYRVHYKPNGLVVFLNGFSFPLCIGMVTPNHFMDWTNNILTLRDTKTGGLISSHPLGKLASKSFVISQNGFLLMWCKGMLECYFDLKLKWKKPLTRKPDQCFFHRLNKFVITYDNSSLVRVVNANDGLMTQHHTIGHNPAEDYCETETGIVRICDAVLYHLDIRSGKSTTLAQLPSGYRYFEMIQTNPDYLVTVVVEVTKPGPANHYRQIYRISTGKKCSVISSSRSSFSMVGIGDHVIALPSDKLGIDMYDISTQKWSTVSYRYASLPGNIIPLGNDRIISYSDDKITILG